MDALIYQYTIGGGIFALGLYYGFRQGFLGWHGRPKTNLLLVLGAFGFYLAVQSHLQYAPMVERPPEPYNGGADHILQPRQGARGTWLDWSIMGGYFLAILGIGTWFGRNQKSTKDFFFGGQRFSWWVIAASLVATTIGSYSFVKYSNKGYMFGLSSTQTYWNDWIWLPFLLFGWLPILYFSRVTSIPEYFGRRFGRGVRLAATLCLLIYMVGYVGVNLFTMGKVLNALVGWPIWLSAFGVALVSASYVTAGGQTSVIMTDLFQGAMLVVTGLLILGLGVMYVGGVAAFWEHLPREARLAFPNFNEDGGFPSVGIFWQDAIANSAMLYFLNQGMMMRFVAAKSLPESRKAALFTLVILMSIAAVVVSGAGWVARALVHSGHLPDTLPADQAFYVALDLVSKPGVFGLVLAALTAALMSTVDTLITAVSAVVVNDIYRLYFRPKADDRELLRAARITSVSVTLLGVLLVPMFMMFKSIYEAHGAFTAAVTPPMVVTLLLSVFWRRFTYPAALATLLGGLAVMALSILWPDIVNPFSHGVPAGENGGGLLGGLRMHMYMRACFGVLTCFGIGVTVTLFTRPQSEAAQRGLVWGSVAHALAHYLGKSPRETGTEEKVRKGYAVPRPCDAETAARFSISDDVIDPQSGVASLSKVRVSTATAMELDLQVGDLIYVADARPWDGGLHASHAALAEIVPGTDAWIEMEADLYESVVVRKRRDQPVRIEKLY